MNNQFKTALLLGTLTALLMLVGQLIGGFSGLTIGLIFALGMNFGSYWFSDKIVLAMYRAKEADAKENRRLYRIVREVAELADIPMPKIYIIPSSSPNAFATGRNPKKAAVACTKGITELLSDDELKGVIAHELSHIKHRDTLIATIAASIAGVISYVAFIARWGAIFGGFGGRNDRDGNSILEFIVLAIVTPLMATLIQLAISRSREFLADESAARMLHSGESLADALIKIEQNIPRNPLLFGNKATASLFIANPFTKGMFLKMFSTHPPTEERVRRLRKMH